MAKKSITLKSIAKTLKPHLNEIGIYGGSELCRLIGVAEDGMDFYYVVEVLNNPSGTNIHWFSYVGEWDSLANKRLKNYNYMDDVFAMNGAPKVKKFEVLSEKSNN
ncbi:Uncharacterised protein [uncultured archaeon]|nr:Uncharacterised protein [uncultured archaeon]